jgi:hypothetical protein
LPEEELWLREKPLFISFPLTNVVVLFLPPTPRRLANTDKNNPGVDLVAPSDSSFFCFLDTPLFSLKSKLLPSTLLFLQNKV